MYIWNLESLQKSFFCICGFVLDEVNVFLSNGVRLIVGVVENHMGTSLRDLAGGEGRRYVIFVLNFSRKG